MYFSTSGAQKWAATVQLMIMLLIILMALLGYEFPAMPPLGIW